MPKVYDCFPFFNEFDLLELRLNELDSVVDRFVLVEATKNFRKQDKPLYFDLNKERFQKFLPKITHIVVDTYPNFFTRFRVPKNWDYERNQKDSIAKGLVNCQPDDVVLMSDLDEIPRKEKVQEALNLPGVKVFRQRMYHYFLNCFIEDYNEPLSYVNGYKPWQGSVMVNYRDFKSFDFHRTARNTEFKEKVFIEEGGWHYSWFGGYESILKKLKAYSHKENEHTQVSDTTDIRRLILEGIDISNMGAKLRLVEPYADCSQYILENKEKFKEFILPE